LRDQEVRIRDQESREIANKISSLSVWATQNDTFERHQEGTGEWMLKHADFQDWIEGDNNVLWLPGGRKLPFAIEMS